LVRFHRDGESSARLVALGGALREVGCESVALGGALREFAFKFIRQRYRNHGF
jgi:hypothetical protein